MVQKLFPDGKSFACVFLFSMAVCLVLFDTTGLLSVGGVGISLGVFLGNLLLA